MPSDFLVGICHPGRKSYPLLKDAGINTIRVDVPFPFADAARALSTGFVGTAEWIGELRREGFLIIGITFYPQAVPDWQGSPGSDGWFALVREGCRFLGAQFGGEVPVWQATNEMNVDHFRVPLTESDAVRFVIESARGVNESAPAAMIGANMGGFNMRARDMFRGIYAADLPWGYVGVDGYFGTWEEGGPKSWNSWLDWCADLAPLPVIVMEWGFSSAGGIMAREDIVLGATDPHAHKKWCFGWDAGREVRPHTWDVQARYIEEAFPIFRERTIGACYYCWGDSTRCWCPAPDCPVESNWGLVDTNGNPKPSYHALRRAVRGG